MNYSKKGTKKKQEALSKKEKKKNKKAVFVLKIVLIVVLAAIVVTGCVGVKIVKDIIADAPEVDVSDISPEGFKSVVLDAEGNVTAELVAEGSNRVMVDLEDIPLDLQHAFVAIEDMRFYEHNGIDIKGIVRAAVKGVANGFEFSEGASTITQQLLKNNVFDNWTSETDKERWTRKIQEQYLAVQLEKEVDKDVIMENYLNTINLGQNCLGVQAASHRYFGKDVSELTLSECAVIAGITKSPAALNPISYPDKNAERRELVLRNMLEQGYIDQTEYDEALADNVYERIQVVNVEEESSTNITSYFVDALTDDVVEDLQELAGYTEEEAYDALYRGGLTIYSTQDPAIQEVCDSVVNNDEYYAAAEVSFSYALSIEREDGTVEHLSEGHLRKYYNDLKDNDGDYNINYATEEEAQAAIDAYREAIVKEGDKILGEKVTFTKQPQIALTVMDQSNGQVVALVGGRGEKTASRTLNRATNSKQQAGSTFKILSTYAPALELGEYTLATVVDNAPYAYESGYSISNYNGKFTGLTSIRYSIIDSINIVAVKTLTDISVQTGIDYLEKFGFTTIGPEDIGQTIALGGLQNGIYNIELTAAYAAIANKGVYNEPVLYTKIVDHDGNVIIEKEPETREVISEQTAWLLTSAMQDVITKGTGGAAYFPGMSIAGKTGTTNSNRDTVFAAYTPYYTCAVWGGYDDNSTLSSTRFSAQIWKGVMSQIHVGLSDPGFSKPDNITSVTVCSKSGLRPVEDLCEETHTEYFAKGTVPSESCDVHVKAKICKESGLLANEYCPADGVEEKLFIKEATEGTSDVELVVPEETEVCTLHNESTFQQTIEGQLQEQLQQQIQGSQGEQSSHPGQTQKPTTTTP